jgi:hypothetical protein
MNAESRLAIMFPKLLMHNIGATSVYISQYIIMFCCYVVDTEGTFTLLLFFADLRVLVNDTVIYIKKL